MHDFAKSCLIAVIVLAVAGFALGLALLWLIADGVCQVARWFLATCDELTTFRFMGLEREEEY
jgi:hypothetical protein